MLKFLRDCLNPITQRIENKAWIIYPATGILSGLLFVSLVILGSLASQRDLAQYSRLDGWAVALNSLVLLACFSILFAATNRWAFSFTLTFYGSAALMAFNAYKCRILGGPLMPGDIFLLPMGLDMLGVIFSFAGLPILIFLILTLVALKLLVRLFRVRRLSVAFWKRALALGCGLLLLAWPLAYGLTPPDSDFWLSPIHEVQWDKTEHYQKNGLFLAFLVDVARLLRPVPPPAGYSPGALGDIARQAAAPPSTTTSSTAPRITPSSTPQEPANVIVFLAESFCDVQALNIKTTGDPTPFFHSLRTEGAAGSFLVPTYGGITVRTEFEVLTGLSMAYLPEVVDPYGGSLNLNRQLPALPRVFAEHQYRTSMIHACDPLGECSTVYPEFGFQRFYTLKDMKNPKNRGPYTSDESLLDKVIDVADESLAKNEPFFIMTDSMGTHGPYESSRGADETLDVVTTMSQSSHAILKTYINSVARMDEQWRRLADHFRGSKNPTLIVIFGDHMPPLGDDFKVYKELGYYANISSSTLETKIHMTPVGAWANYRLPRADLARRSSTLYSYILKAAGLPLDAYGEFNDYLARQSVKAGGIADDLDAAYRMVQYDLLFGEKYLEGSKRPITFYVSKHNPQLEPYRR